MARKFPSIKDVAAELRELNENVEGECDVRLQVYEGGKWCIRYGDSSYDQDHRGAFGASCIPGVVNGKAVRFNSEVIAKDLLRQVREVAEFGETSRGY
jgi:hypothetical protein